MHFLNVWIPPSQRRKKSKPTVRKGVRRRIFPTLYFVYFRPHQIITFRVRWCVEYLFSPWLSQTDELCDECRAPSLQLSTAIYTSDGHSLFYLMFNSNMHMHVYIMHANFTVRVFVTCVHYLRAGRVPYPSTQRFKSRRRRKGTRSQCPHKRTMTPQTTW